jgi:hypothetical protein
MGNRGVFFDCPRCGLFGLTYHAETAALPSLLATPRKRSVLSYAISRTPRTGPNTTVFDAEQCERIVKADYLPTPQEQAENLVRLLGDHLSGPGQRLRITFPEHATIIGALSSEGFFFIVQGLMSSGLLHADLVGGAALATLTFAGWSRYEQLRRGVPTGRKAFIAMEYGHTDLDALVSDHFKPAVAETGFVLRRLDDEQPAGLIDDRLRVEIQSSRFLLVDLTHRNLGAYWEAGYAEGLGKPVIYTCEHSKFEEVSHFDTNHRLHVLWNRADIEPALKKLKATIRATIPEADRE